jgi:glutamine amidotransferase
MTIIVDSGVANFLSVTAAFERLDVHAEVTADPAKIRDARRVVLPGVGSAAAAMGHLRQKRLTDVLYRLTQPVLGICLGMELLFADSEEGQNISCLGIIPGSIKALRSMPDMPVPHMGWNTITARKPGHPLLRHIPDNSFVYFVHGFAAPIAKTTVAQCDYGVPFTAIAQHNNFFGCQFHPERSGKIGSQILQNFLEL